RRCAHDMAAPALATLALHDALPILARAPARRRRRRAAGLADRARRPAGVRHADRQRRNRCRAAGTLPRRAEPGSRRPDAIAGPARRALPGTRSTACPRLADRTVASAAPGTSGTPSHAATYLEHLKQTRRVETAQRFSPS